MKDLGREHDVRITLTVPPHEAIEAIAERPHIGQMALRLEAWIGEFGELDVATAFAAGYARLVARRRGLAPRSVWDRER